MANEKMSKDFSEFIVELSTNKTDEDREKSRKRLQKQFEACDSKLNGIVKDNRGNLSNIVEHCSKIIHSVNDSKTRCKALKERITSCMSLLQCNRDNIRRMWLESLEHQYAHKILREIEDLRAAPKKIQESLINKKLEHATEVIVSSVKLLDGNLCNSDALKDLKLELQCLQEKLYTMALEDLRKNLHLTDFVSEHYDGTLNEVTYEDVFSYKAQKSEYSLKELLNRISLDQDYITVLLKSVKTMNRLQEALEVLKNNCQMELMTISQEIAKLMVDVVEKSTESSPLNLPIQKQHVFLVDLIENTTIVFQKILGNYKSLFFTLDIIIETNTTDIDFHIEDVYSKVQFALENLVSLYFESTCLPVQKDLLVFDGSQNIADVNEYFSTQNLSSNKSSTLFKFSNSSHGINLKKYSKEMKAAEFDIEPVKETEQTIKPVLVCRPALKNIIVIYSILKDFISDIEQSLNLANEEHCPIYSFLHDSANLYLDHVNSDINKMLKSAYVNLDAWNTTSVGDSLSSRSGSEKEILSCSLILDNIMKELENLMHCIPEYSDHFVKLLYYVILEYKDMYHKAFKQMFEDEQNSILSISWARDRDIRRLMKSFLNWRHLEDEGTQDAIESPEEVRMRNKEESELLIRNLLSEDEASWEIITSANRLSNLALLQENLIWFSVKLLKFIKNHNLSQTNIPTSDDLQSDAPENSISGVVLGLRKLIKEYEDFADMCLLALHLEVRARCFHYLLTFSSREICVESSFIQDLDTAVKSLTSDLLQIDEVLLPILTPKEFKYVFEGLGELVASLMILIVSNMNKINETVVSKIDRNIFIIQCCLANITMVREVSLERARQFIDLLKSTHEEILDQIVEEGPRFNEQEYVSVFRLISSSTTGSPQEPEYYYLEKLKLIFERLATNTKRDIPEVP